MDSQEKLVSEGRSRGWGISLLSMWEKAQRRITSNALEPVEGPSSSYRFSNLQFERDFAHVRQVTCT